MFNFEFQYGLFEENWNYKKTNHLWDGTFRKEISIVHVQSGGTTEPYHALYRQPEG